MKTTTEQMREAVKALDTYVSEQLEDYEFRGDLGDYTPNETERMLMNDFVQGMLSDDEFFVLTGKVAALRESAPAPQKLTDEERITLSLWLTTLNDELNELLASEAPNDVSDLVQAQYSLLKKLSRSTAPQEAALPAKETGI